MNKNVQVIYWDASAVLSALFTDTHSKVAKKWSTTEGFHFVSTLTFTEVTAVISRMQRERILAGTLSQAAFEVLNDGPWRRISTLPDWEIIRSLSAKWPLRGADLWHLSTAKSLLREFPELILLSFDKRLKWAAEGETLGTSKF
jgi:predicted nucleic acid-binding protein